MKNKRLKFPGNGFQFVQGAQWRKAINGPVIACVSFSRLCCLANIK